MINIRGKYSTCDTCAIYAPADSKPRWMHAGVGCFLLGFRSVVAADLSMARWHAAAVIRVTLENLHIVGKMDVHAFDESDAVQNARANCKTAESMLNYKVKKRSPELIKLRVSCNSKSRTSRHGERERGRERMLCWSRMMVLKCLIVYIWRIMFYWVCAVCASEWVARLQRISFPWRSAALIPIRHSSSWMRRACVLRIRCCLKEFCRHD